jgi:hypothetical protein
MISVALTGRIHERTRLVSKALSKSLASAGLSIHEAFNKAVLHRLFAVPERYPSKAPSGREAPFPATAVDAAGSRSVKKCMASICGKMQGRQNAETKGYISKAERIAPHGAALLFLAPFSWRLGVTLPH